jgi:hypothetical protein
MSRMNKTPEITMVEEEAWTAAEPIEEYKPQHPMLQFQYEDAQKEDHLCNYQEVSPLESKAAKKRQLRKQNK